jgi:hypothetical protein
MSSIPQWVAPVHSIVTGLFLPYLISYVAVSTKRWLNLLASFGSSALVGVLTAWLAGSFSADVWASVLAAVTATQLAYNAYWKQKLTPDVPPAPSAQ